MHDCAARSLVPGTGAIGNFTDAFNLHSLGQNKNKSTTSNIRAVNKNVVVH